MNSTMKIAVKFTDEAFEAAANITFDTSIKEKQFSFILNDSLTITEITCNGKLIDYEILGTIQPQFRPLSKKVIIRSEEIIESITLNYSGTVAYSQEKQSCWHNIITRDIKSLSFYSAWYPQETSIEINNDEVILLDGDRYFLVKGVFNKEQNTWEYGNRGYDPFNIMAYRKDVLKTVSNEYMNIYFVDESIEKYAKKSSAVYHDVLNFYNGNLFEKREISVLDIACASPAITTGGGYMRRDFMWYTTLGNNNEEIAWLNAHETAHIWCCGADYCSWEDWLNETTAEWSSLLFALYKNDTALFDFILNPKLEKYASLPPIKTADGSRPKGVHDKGTVMFYNMYKLFGVEAVRKVVKTFADLDNKTTDSLLQALCSNSASEIAHFISDGILK